MEWITTSTILSRLRAFDDQSMWEQFHTRFRAPLLAFVRRFGLTDSAAEDVVQETLLAFAQAYREGRYDPAKGRLSSWLFGIAFRQASSARRSQARTRARQAPGSGDTFWDETPDPQEAEQAWDREWEVARLAQSIEQLRREVTQRTFRIFELLVQQQRSPDEAAAELGMTRDAVYVAKHRLLKRLGELVNQHDALE